MAPRHFKRAALCLSATLPTILAATGGTFVESGSTLVSALMMFLGNDENVYILDKAEGNAAPINGHPAWGSRWNIQTHEATAMEIKTNSFCASGMFMPDGSWASFGGNDAVTIAGKPGSQKNPDGTGAWDSVYNDFDGRRAIRTLKPCSEATGDDLTSVACNWVDEPIGTGLMMKKKRWYSAAEPLGDGTVIIIGGFVNGGYINRWFPMTDTVTQNGGAENTYEYYPAKDMDPPVVNFLTQTGGLNSYVHTYLMPSGKLLLQANVSTMLWDHENNIETPLPPMPNGVVRVYPASGATAMLPLTPANNYEPTLLFCGGIVMTDEQWGDYVSPRVQTWNIPASTDCQRLTPEPQSGAAPAYEQDDDMLEGRSMGQFIALPDGKMLVLNGVANGTAGYATGIPAIQIAQDEMPYGVSLGAGPVLTPVLYDPLAPKGSRWSRKGLQASKIPRVYHSTAILLPDASVFVAGSNSNPDVDLDTFFPTEYRSEIFYPPYFDAPVRPAPTGQPKTLSYGGPSFDLTLPKSSYTGPANDAADKTTVVVMRSGFTTHAMNMGQRYLQLRNSYTVNKDGSITLHVSQLPPNPNLFQPGPALLFVTVDGVPSNGSFVIVGSGKVEQQAVATDATLPANVRLDGVVGGVDSATNGTTNGNGTTSANGSKGASKDESGSSKTPIIIGVVVAAAALLLIGGLIALVVARRRRARNGQVPSAVYTSASSTVPVGMNSMEKPSSGWASTHHAGESGVFVPLNKASSESASTSQVNLVGPYRDSGDAGSVGGSQIDVSYGGGYQQQHQQGYGQQGYQGYQGYQPSNLGQGYR
ncbi:copper radical oxidase [Agrocybe pediades]|nr:copper radical oxidase [Agrocybe pediades]